ncbi:MAG: SAM-dependent methyltransferase [Nitrospira sp.]|nr:SAM-dependent methyltransferase [Nitrospira sp.]
MPFLDSGWRRNCEERQKIISMQREQSQQRPKGCLYVVAVPLGHHDDITVRALHILRDVDLIVSENPTVTSRLLNHHRLSTPITSYGPTDIPQKVAVLIDRLKRGVRLALVSDCGSPVVADPGSTLVRSAQRHGIPVISIPGPSALTAAVSLAGLSSDHFVFVGQLPTTEQAIHRRLSMLLTTNFAVVAFCITRSLLPALRVVASLAPRRRLVVACDLTLPHERVLIGAAARLHKQLREAPHPLPQSITLVISGGATRKEAPLGHQTTNQN